MSGFVIRIGCRVCEDYNDERGCESIIEDDAGNPRVFATKADAEEAAPNQCDPLYYEIVSV